MDGWLTGSLSTLPSGDILMVFAGESMTYRPSREGEKVRLTRIAFDGGGAAAGEPGPPPAAGAAPSGPEGGAGAAAVEAMPSPAAEAGVPEPEGGGGTPAAAPGPPRSLLLDRQPEATTPVEEAAAFYAGLLRRFYPGGRPVEGALREVLPAILANLPRSLSDPVTLVEAHLAVLDSEKDCFTRRHARAVLGVSAEGVRILLERRSWEGLGLRGKREVAVLLGSCPAVSVEALANLLGDPADPVVLLALMLKTRHTYGAPPKYLLPDAEPPVPAVTAHWKGWLGERWPEVQRLAFADRYAAEISEIRAVFERAGPDDVADAIDRLAALRSFSFAGFGKDRGVDPEEARHYFTVARWRGLEIDPSSYGTE